MAEKGAPLPVTVPREKGLAIGDIFTAQHGQGGPVYPDLRDPSRAQRFIVARYTDG